MLILTRRVGETIVCCYQNKVLNLRRLYGHVITGNRTSKRSRPGYIQKA